jgi:hypothetical protein
LRTLTFYPLRLDCTTYISENPPSAIDWRECLTPDGSAAGEQCRATTNSRFLLAFLSCDQHLDQCINHELGPENRSTIGSRSIRQSNQAGYAQLLYLQVCAIPIAIVAFSSHSSEILLLPCSITRKTLYKYFTSLIAFLHSSVVGLRSQCELLWPETASCRKPSSRSNAWDAVSANCHHMYGDIAKIDLRHSNKGKKSTSRNNDICNCCLVHHRNRRFYTRLSLREV